MVAPRRLQRRPHGRRLSFIGRGRHPVRARPCEGSLPAVHRPMLAEAPTSLNQVSAASPQSTSASSLAGGCASSAGGAVWAVAAVGSSGGSTTWHTSPVNVSSTRRMCLRPGEWHPCVCLRLLRVVVSCGSLRFIVSHGGASSAGFASGPHKAMLRPTV